MLGTTTRLSLVALLVYAVSASSVADSTAERESLAAIARDLDILSEAVRRLELRSSGTSREGSRYRFDHLRLRLEELEDSIRLYLQEVESEPRRAWRVDVITGRTERVAPDE